MKIRDLGQIITGNTPSKNNKEYYESNDICFFKPGDLEEDIINDLYKSEEYISYKAKDAVRLLPKGTILMTCIGTIGKVGILNQDATCNQQINGIIPNEENNSRYIGYLLLSMKEKLKKKANAPVVPIINKTDFSNIDIFVHNKEEQDLIANRLDKVSFLITIKKKNIDNLNKLVKSQFVEMFGDPIINDKDWKVDIINNVAPSENYKGEFDDKVWLLNLDMVESNSGKVIDYVFEDRNNVGNSTCTFNEENVLYSKLRPYLNKVVIPNQKGYATSELVPLKPKKDILNRYFLAYLLRSNQFVQYISEKVAGAKMPRVSMDMFRSFNLILPPIELQNKFSDFVKQVDKQKFCNCMEVMA